MELIACIGIRFTNESASKKKQNTGDPRSSNAPLSFLSVPLSLSLHFEFHRNHGPFCSVDYALASSFLSSFVRLLSLSLGQLEAIVMNQKYIRQEKDKTISKAFYLIVSRAVGLMK